MYAKTEEFDSCWQVEKTGEVAARHLGGVRLALGNVPARVLLFNCDAGVVEVLRRSMAQVAMLPEVCCDEASASIRLSRSECEAIVIDLKERTTNQEFLKKIQGMSAHRRVIVLAVLDADNDIEGAFRAGANFVLERPLFPRIVSRTLKAAYPLMLQERRRHFRCPLQFAVQITLESKRLFQATALNVSEGGIALKTDVPLHPGQGLQLQFVLPGTSRSINIWGRVGWNHASGRAGIQFSQVPSAIVEQIQQWLLIWLRRSVCESRRPVKNLK